MKSEKKFPHGLVLYGLVLIAIMFTAFAPDTSSLTVDDLFSGYDLELAALAPFGLLIAVIFLL